jgi:hypothetical protein
MQTCLRVAVTVSGIITRPGHTGFGAIPSSLSRQFCHPGLVPLKRGRLLPIVVWRGG